MLWKGKYGGTREQKKVKRFLGFIRNRRLTDPSPQESKVNVRILHIVQITTRMNSTGNDINFRRCSGWVGSVVASHLQAWAFKVTPSCCLHSSLHPTGAPLQCLDMQGGELAIASGYECMCVYVPCHGLALCAVHPIMCTVPSDHLLTMGGTWKMDG